MPLRPLNMHAVPINKGWSLIFTRMAALKNNSKNRFRWSRWAPYRSTYTAFTAVNFDDPPIGYHEYSLKISIFWISHKLYIPFDSLAHRCLLKWACTLANPRIGHGHYPIFQTSTTSALAGISASRRSDSNATLNPHSRCNSEDDSY